MENMTFGHAKRIAMNAVARALVGIAAALGLAACGAGPTPSAPLTSVPSGPAGTIEQDYRLGSGDELRVIVFGEEDLSGEFVVDGSGQVSLPLIGQVRAQGLTVPEFEQNIETSLAQGYLNEPRVSAEVLNYRPFYILGEVNKPGEYPYSAGLSVVNAVATAEGFTYRADTRRVFIKHAGEAGEREYPLTTETEVLPGDTIRIRERFF